MSSRSRSPKRDRRGSERERDGGGKGGGRDRNDDAKLYVGNLVPHLEEPDVRALFEKFGELSDVYLPKDPSTGEKRGFAFVTFVDEKDSKDAIAQLDGKEVEGRPLKVNKPRQGKNDGGGDRGGGGGDRGGYRGGERTIGVVERRR